MTTTVNAQQQWNPNAFDHYLPTEQIQNLVEPSRGGIAQPALSSAPAVDELARPRRGVPLDQGRYWVGSVLTAGVAALAGTIGIVIAQDLLKMPLSLASLGMSGAGMGLYGMLAALLALLAAGLFDGMLAFAPRPVVYYSWLTSLLVVLAVLMPFTAGAAFGAQVALALINLVVGVAIVTLVPVAASNARRS